MLTRFTTPSLLMTLKNKQGEPLTDLVFDYLVVSIRQKGITIDKKVMFDQVEEAQFKVSFSQNETGMLREDNPVSIQLNIWKAQDRIASDIKHFKSVQNLLDMVVIDYE